MPDYFKEKMKSPWDCQTICSTYSNLDNHPTRLSEPKASKKKNEHDLQKNVSDPASTLDAPKRIVLSLKSGLPVGVLERKLISYVSEVTQVASAIGELAENKGAVRSRNETAEEKRIRKAVVKEERFKKRHDKRELKTAFKNDDLGNQRRVATIGSGPGSQGVAVFRY
jgi:protein LTV1